MGRRKKAVLFWKKEPKNFCLFAPDAEYLLLCSRSAAYPPAIKDPALTAEPRDSQKFFGSFFQKRTFTVLPA
jgi:hypothetical protein